MNIRNTILLLFLAIGFALSCETEKIHFTGPYFVRFTDSSEVKLESYSHPIQIEVHYAGPALTKDITITYAVSGSARENVDYKILGNRGVVTINKDEYFGYIELQLINNSNNILRSQDVIFTLQKVSSNDLQVGQGESGIARSFTFTIKDDCILGGTYIGEKNLLTVPIENISITSADCENYTLSDWDIYAFPTPQYDWEFMTIRSLTFIDNGDNTLTIPVQKDPTFPDSLATIKGSGVFDPSTRKLYMTVILDDYKDKPEKTFSLIAD